MFRRGDGRRIRSPGSVQLPVEDQVIGLLGRGTGGGVQALFLAQASDVALSGGKVTTWSDASGLGRDATQGTDAARLTWNATGINGRPSLSSTATTQMATAAIDLSSFERVSLSVIFKVTGGSPTTVGIYSEFTNVANGMIRVFSDLNTRLSALGRAATGLAETRSAASFAMTTAGLVRASVDYTLATQATRIWHNTTDITASFASNPDLSAQAVGNGPLYISNRADAALGLIGELAAVMLCAWPTATAFPAGLATAERALMANWGF